MRKTSMFVVIILILNIVFTSCDNKPIVNNERSDSTSTQVTAQKIFDINEHYNIIKHSDDEYSLILYGTGKNKVIEEQYPKEPSVNLLEDETIQITLSVGSPASYVHYFNVRTNEISDVYFNPILAQKGRIVYMNDGKLIISDIFDKSKIFGKIVRDFSPTANPSSAILEAKFPKNNQLFIHYLEGSELVETSEIIDLTQ